ncbi:Pentatricopeptide repeat-containing protein [Rhynchospora pubera]|uniref:Pentatricopeptide repeat-containing protein n=1 Tax=Rhynchospora pubera TaxID=906938 RepID=A0AAV8G9N7_9POAL|nr:Pentatricopeptide repeat-containing protein [Rhynchospora pubera]
MPFTAASLSPFPTVFLPKRHHFLFPSIPFTSRRLPIPASLLSSETLIQSDLQLEPDDPHQAPDYNSLDTWTERDMRSLPSPELEVIRLEDLPEQWRRARIAWLCKELPAYKQPTVVRILNGQRKWISQDDATYVAVHCMRVREYESAFRVYSWMSQQRWYQFNFALATKLADHLGKNRKIAKCREVFDDITKQGRVASESTFHILIIAYLSAPADGGIDEACTIYNQMVKQGGYRPRLTLHNSMFKALVSRTGGTSKHYLKQAEFIYHNLVTMDLEVRKDIYAGLIWLHSYQDKIDRERIIALREEMKGAGFKETSDVLVSVMRAFSKEGDLEETEKAWLRLLKMGSEIPSQAFVCRMELYSRIGEPMKSLEIFKQMKEVLRQPNISAYHKIINVMSKAQEVELAQALMDEFMETSMKHLMPAFLDMMYMYLNLEMHEKLASIFTKCLSRCRPNRVLYSIYLESLVRTNNIPKAEELFTEMQENATIGTTAKSCNMMLRGFLSAGEYIKAEKLHNMMRHKKYEIRPDLLEKIQNGLFLNKNVVDHKNVVDQTVSIRLGEEQREILIGLFLGGLEVAQNEQNRNHAICFSFQQGSDIHSVLRIHVFERFYEWLAASDRSIKDETETPYQFSTVSHLHFNFFATQFRMNSQPAVPKLIHRWLSPCVLAYWYMYAGFKHSSGDILLRLKGGKIEDVERIVKSLKEKSILCKVKRKGRVSWIGMQGSSADTFLKLVEPYLLDFCAKDDDSQIKEINFGYPDADSEVD